eukprot:7384507-Prymnesium_polylepis.1
MHSHAPRLLLLRVLHHVHRTCLLQVQRAVGQQLDAPRAARAAMQRLHVASLHTILLRHSSVNLRALYVRRCSTFSALALASSRRRLRATAPDTTLAAGKAIIVSGSATAIASAAASGCAVIYSGAASLAGTAASTAASPGASTDSSPPSALSTISPAVISRRHGIVPRPSTSTILTSAQSSKSSSAARRPCTRFFVMYVAMATSVGFFRSSSCNTSISTFFRIAFGTALRRRPIKNDRTFIRLFTSGRVTGFCAPSVPCHASRAEHEALAHAFPCTPLILTFSLRHTRLQML